MRHNIYIYILITALVSYGIRMLPMVLLRKEIKSPFIRSFLYYVPYVTQHFGRGQIADLSGNGGSLTESGRRSSGTDLWDLGGMVSWGLV